MAGVTGALRRARRVHWPRVVLPSAATLVAVGAFLLWGPIGIGNGPLSMGVGATEGWLDTIPGPLGFVLPVVNTGSGHAVVDGIGLLDNTNYPRPRLLATEAIAGGLCGGAWPVRAAAHGFAFTGECHAKSLGPLIGHGFGHETWTGANGAVEVSPPRPGTCWVVTSIVVHYHVGIRHYSATDPYELVVCAGTHYSAVDAALTAAETASG